MLWNARVPTDRRDMLHSKNGTMRFELGSRDLSMFAEQGKIIVVEGSYTVTVGGGQPNTRSRVDAGTFRVRGTSLLPQ